MKASRPRKIRVLFAVQEAIVIGANKAMAEVFGPHAADTFTVKRIKGGVTWYVACGVFDVAGLPTLRAKIKSQIALGNAIVWTNCGRVTLNDEGYLTISRPGDVIRNQAPQDKHPASKYGVSL